MGLGKIAAIVSDPGQTIASYAEATEESLVGMMHEDGKALSELLARLAGPLRARLEIPSRHRSLFDVDDVVQITFIEAFLHIGKFCSRGPDSFLAWLVRLAKNNLRDAIRELSREKRGGSLRRVGGFVDDESYAVLLANLTGTGTTPSQGAARSEAKGLIESTLAKIPEDYAKVIRMYDLQGKTAEEVARNMSRSVGAVYMLKGRAYKLLREFLGRSSNFFVRGVK